MAASYHQQQDVPEPRPAIRYQHDLHKARCACGKVHVAARPAGVPDAPLSVGPRLDIRGYIDTARKHGHNAYEVLHQLMLGNPWLPPAQPISP